MTFCTTRLPLKPGADYALARLVFSSWLGQSPRARVRVFADGAKFDRGGHLARELGDAFGAGRLEFVGELKSGLSGVPLISAWFRRSAECGGFVCVINADIVLSVGWFDRVAAAWADVLRQAPGARIVAVGQSYDDVRWRGGALLGGAGWTADLRALERLRGWTLRNELCSDWFLLRAGALCFDPALVPPFVMGHYLWDRWVLDRGRACEGLSATAVAASYHFAHPRRDWRGPAVQLNRELLLAGADGGMRAVWRARQSQMPWVANLSGGRVVAQRRNLTE